MSQRPLENYTIVRTEDGSETVFSKLFNEACHSTSGAVSETDLHYIRGCQIESKLIESDICVFEVGFGVGIGFLRTLEVLKKYPTRKLTFYSVEIDEELVCYIMQKYPELKLAKMAGSPLCYESHTNQFKLIILVGDARKTVPAYFKTNPQFDAIYQDAFSPKRNAWLWTKEWFELLKSLSRDRCIMSTYSSSSSIRLAMLAAGWRVKKGDQFGPKRSSTRAYLLGESDSDILEHLKRSGAPMLEDKMAGDYSLENKK